MTTEPPADDQPDLNALIEKFGRDPEALAWARGLVQRRVDKYRKFSTEARDRGNEELAGQWRKFANLLQMEFIGGTGCTIAPFDERRPQLPSPVQVPDPRPASMLQPADDEPALGWPRTILNPHAAWYSPQSRSAPYRIAAEAVAAVLDGREPPGALARPAISR